MRLQRVEGTRSLAIIPWIVGATEVSEEGGEGRGVVVGRLQAVVVFELE